MRGRHRLPLVVVFLAVASLLHAAAVGGSGNGKLAFVSEAGYLYAVDPTSGVEADRGLGTEPAWSPDGSKIAFSSGGVNVMNADGSGRRLLHASPGDRRPVWSPAASRRVTKPARRPRSREVQQ